MMLSQFQQAAAALADRAWPEDRDNPHLADCLIARLAEETGELAQTVRLLAGPRPGRPGEAAATRGTPKAASSGLGLWPGSGDS